MKRTLLTAVMAAMTFPVFAADVGISVNVGQPDFYGQLNIGSYPPPQLVYQQPIVIERGPVAAPPIYLHVAPGHAKRWRDHCREYDACGRPVYFVRNKWYNDVYVPQYRERQERRHEKHHGKGHHDDHGPGRGRGYDDDHP